MNSYRSVEKHVAAIADDARLLHEGRHIGIEKESLRVGPHGTLAKTPHPRALGSALTHPCITTDYSEALLELVTPPLPDADAVLASMTDIHAFVHTAIGDELLWPASMPCIVRNETDIPLAHYGSSNPGRMKTIYRRGLGHRYGRPMQTIAGVHFNHSFGPRLWETLHAMSGGDMPLDTFRSRRYMGLIRNFLRIGWLVPYLFGISPAVCRSFLDASTHKLKAFDETTLYGRYATSLRMGDIGYQNNQEAKIGVKASYNSLQDYATSLEYAVKTECEEYRRIGVKVGGEYQQLSAGILQIENEYYGTMRPKRTAGKNEMPLAALKRRGVEYVELRSLDVNVFEPTGVDGIQLRFLEALAVLCLLADSAPVATRDWREIDSNEIITAHEGRRPGLQLSCGGRARGLQEWGLEICECALPICELLDADAGNGGREGGYTAALHEQLEKLRHPDACPSARLLDAMHESRHSFVGFAEQQAVHFRNHFAARPPDAGKQAWFKRLAEDSLAEQARLEVSDARSLDEYIADYFAQLDS